jgi:tight adherence protein B
MGTQVASAMVPTLLGCAAIALQTRAGRVRDRSVQARVLGQIAHGRKSGWMRIPPRVRAAGRGAATASVVVFGTWLGWFVGGVATAAAGGIGAVVALRFARRRKTKPDVRALDQQVGELAEGVASGVRGGLSIAQAVAFAAAEARPPLKAAAEEFLAARDVGVSFQLALGRLADRVGTDEVRLLAMVLGVHHRSGGNVAGALDDVAATIRHRLKLRRELLALTAQGRISGLVLGVLPVGFFLVLALTSRSQLQPVLHSVPGALMVSVGFLLEGLAFLWIRRLLRVDA